MINAAQLTRTIKQTLAEYIAVGDVTCAYQIGNGFCEEFANAVLEKLGIDAVGELESAKTGGPYTWDTCDFWADDFYMDLPKLREIGEPVPTDIPEDQLASLLGGATHTWVYSGGKHYDAMNPHGVEHFLELSFFAAQIDAFRKEIAQAA